MASKKKRKTYALTTVLRKHVVLCDVFQPPFRIAHHRAAAAIYYFAVVVGWLDKVARVALRDTGNLPIEWDILNEGIVKWVTVESADVGIGKGWAVFETGCLASQWHSCA